MKGITPVIAIILLLLITISVIGFATGFFQTLVMTTGEGATAAANATTQQLGKVVKLENAVDDGTDTIITVRAIGYANVPVNEIGIFIAGNPEACATWLDPAANPITEIATSTLGVCTVSGTLCAEGTAVKVTSPGGEYTGTCEP